MPKDPENWLKKHLPPVVAPDATRVRRPGPRRTPAIDRRRLANILANTGQNRTIGPATPGAHQVGALDVAALLTKPLHAAANFVTNGGLDALQQRASVARGGTTEQRPTIDYASLDPKTAVRVAMEQQRAGDPLLAAALPGKTPPLPKIARAAIKLEDGSIHWGRSHAAAIDAAIRDGALPRRGASKMLERAVDGFVDAKGNFLTRGETADRIRALGVKLPKDMRDGSFTSEELLGVPSIRRKAMMEPGALPHQGMRSFDESFPSVGEVQQRAAAAAKRKPNIGTVADSVVARAPIFEYGPNASLLREAELLRNDPNLYTAAGPIKYRPEPKSALPKNYAVLTAENPKGTTASAAENAAHNERLAQRLTELGYKFEPVNGGYFDYDTNKWLSENPFFIHDMTGPDAEQLAREFNQNSVLTNHGFHDIANNHLRPSGGVKYAEGNDAYFDLKGKGRFSHLLDWSDEAPTKPLMRPERAVADSALTRAPAFYSRLERAIQNAPMNKGTPQQWAAALSKNVNAGERQWTGVDEFLKNAKGTVTRDQVMEQFNKGKITLGRKTLSDPKVNMKSKYALPEVLTAARDAGATPGDLELTIANDGDAYRALTRRFPELEDDPDWAEKVVHEVFGTNTKPTKFGTYTEPGGTNYREDLFTLQHDALPPGHSVRYDPEFGQWGIVYPNGTFNPGFGTREAAVKSMSRVPGSTAFRSSHFDEPNILVHNRNKDRTVNGERVLHNEETQSDWHQKGRANGYDTEDMRKLRAAAVGRANAAYDAYSNYRALPFAQQNPAEEQRLLAEMRAAQRELNAAGETANGGVPDAPFKKTNDWHLLGLKQLIDDAVRGGYDRIAWTPGELQNARYDLSKQVDRILYDPQQQLLQAEKNGTLIHHGRYDPKALADVIGKEAAERLLASPRMVNSSGQAPHMLEGDALRVGGSGMKGFYDKQRPNILRDYFKSLGVPEPQFEDINIGGGEGRTLTGFRPEPDKMIPSFRISPELRQHVLTKGQPLWAGIMGALGLGAGAWGADPRQQQ